MNQLSNTDRSRVLACLVEGASIRSTVRITGGSQWCGCGRDWESVDSAWAWVVDEIYVLSHPDLFGFDRRAWENAEADRLIAALAPSASETLPAPATV